MERWVEAVMRVMAENELKNPLQLIGGFLALLQDQHKMFVGSGSNQGYNDNLDSLTGRHATTLAESLANYSTVMAMVTLHNAENGRKHGRDETALEQHGRTLKALADLLEYYLPVWNAAGSELEEQLRRVSRQIKQAGGTPLNDPDKDDPEVNPPVPPKRF